MNNKKPIDNCNNLKKNNDLTDIQKDCIKNIIVLLLVYVPISFILGYYSQAFPVLCRISLITIAITIMPTWIFLDEYREERRNRGNDKLKK